ncbi:MAG TPA: lipocalin family protein [Nitrososphaeraceae archaeon]|jgi:hypothetical protein|nr:lipocalin family protein [Nitrososphaeraceae archaeon]
MVDSKLFNYWVLTGKENNGIRIYGPKNTASGNAQQVENEDSFEIKENGEFIKYMMSPDGTPRRYIGRYEIKGDTLYSYFKNHYLDSMFTIVALDDNNVLKIR